MRLQRVCSACGRQLEPGQAEFCGTMCENSSREAFGSEGELFFGDDDEIVLESEARDHGQRGAHNDTGDSHDESSSVLSDDDAERDAAHSQSRRSSAEQLSTRSRSSARERPNDSVRSVPRKGPTSEPVDASPASTRAPQPFWAGMVNGPRPFSQSFAELVHRDSFGLYSGMSLEEGLLLGGELMEGRGTLFISRPPYPHPLFAAYRCHFGTAGLYAIYAFSPLVRLSTHGAPLKTSTRTVRDSLSAKYGAPHATDPVEQSSPMAVGDRKVLALWDTVSLALPRYLDRVELSFEVVRADEGRVCLEYHFSRPRLGFRNADDGTEMHIL